MLTEAQVAEIRGHLEKAQNPLFFFDNDNDGLMSFLLLRRFIDRGRGVAIKSFPELDVRYFRKIEELKPDYIFILDKPLVSSVFLENIRAKNIPVVWIDHHVVEKPLRGDVFYYNPYFVEGSTEPVSRLCYQVTQRKEDLWFALVGCISDAHIPDFYDSFVSMYSELAPVNPKSAFEVLYDSRIGEVARILDFALKDTTTHVVALLRFLMYVRSPLEVFEENKKTQPMLHRYAEINTAYQRLLLRARKNVSENLLFFSYGGQYSLSGNIANQLSYEFPDTVIVVAFTNGDIANVSLRGKDVLNVTMDALKGIEGATGGGHNDATGAKMSVDDLLRFKENVRRLVERD